VKFNCFLHLNLEKPICHQLESPADKIIIISIGMLSHITHPKNMSTRLSLPYLLKEYSIKLYKKNKLVIMNMRIIGIGLDVP
jgi:hypothetical protein